MSAPKSEPIILDFGAGFKSVADRIKKEQERRLEKAKKYLTFGVGFLDQVFGGIAPNDLILVGAKTNKGKTEIARIIGMSNAGKKKNVYYFALEAEEDEIERRMKYALLAPIVCAHGDPLQKRIAIERMNYTDWMMARVHDICARHEPIVDSMIAEAYGTFHTFYRVREFTIADYEKLLLAVQDKADLIILDHLHFVDSDDPSENRGYKITVKKIRDLAISIGKPVIVVAHVRKGERKNLQLVPTIEDFHGSSDVPKIATRAFMIAPAYDQPNSEPHLWNTYISPQKNRIDGGRCKYSAVVQYNAKVGAYEKVFALGQLDPSHEKFTYTDPAAKDYPAWARRDDQRAQPHWTETAK